MRRSRHEPREIQESSLDEPVRGGSRIRRRPALSPGRLLVGLAASAGLASLVAYPAGEAAVALPDTRATAKWVDTAANDELFQLETSAVEGLPRTYAVNRQTAGNGREDILTFGVPGGARGYVRLEIRQAMQGGPDAGLFVALVRRAAQAGLAITRAGLSFVLATRLGPFDASEVTLAADAHEWACVGLRLCSTDTRLQITGLTCGDAGKRPTPAAVACILDALNLAPGSYDPSLRGFFHEAERRRGSLCRKPPPRNGMSQAEPSATPPASAAPAERRHGGRHRSSTVL